MLMPMQTSLVVLEEGAALHRLADCRCEEEEEEEEEEEALFTSRALWQRSPRQCTRGRP